MKNTIYNIFGELKIELKPILNWWFDLHSNTIGPFLADLDTGTKTPVVLSSTYSTTFQEPAIPLPQNNIIQAANIHIFGQLNDPPTPVRPPGLDSFESELSSNFESNNEMSSNIQTICPLNSLNTQNQNGAILEDALLNLNFSLINNSSPTFHLDNRDYYEILDLYLSSPNILDKIFDFKVPYDWDMTIFTKQALRNLVMTSTELTGLNLRVPFTTANMKIALISSLITLRLSLLQAGLSQLNLVNYSGKHYLETLLIQLDKEGKQKDKNQNMRNLGIVNFHTKITIKKLWFLF
ncbi:hypothetical protein BpHYR1_046226 [Brachionus plicatilis]|uniref:Uncharacterized protein n=1 Tax=Brachionus plicatilis TaxID=10195 RepID=A0A3M7T7I5_BRAPC|nr:hypothetical protein BpHYR1_046226 [Brachionus plicatilis]